MPWGDCQHSWYGHEHLILCVTKPGGILHRFWMWHDHKIRYQRSGDAGERVLLVHGFGGNW